MATMTNRQTSDYHPTHRLMLSCRRLNTAIAAGDQLRAEHARADTVKKMAVLLDEFGLTDVAAQVAAKASEFGQDMIDEANAVPTETDSHPTKKKAGWYRNADGRYDLWLWRGSPTPVLTKIRTADKPPISSRYKVRSGPMDDRT